MAFASNSNNNTKGMSEILTSKWRNDFCKQQQQQQKHKHAVVVAVEKIISPFWPQLFLLTFLVLDHQVSTTTNKT
jgi:hypothetical protein